MKAKVEANVKEVHREAFISYSRKDQASFVDRLVDALDAKSISNYIDRHDIEYGVKWLERVKKLIEKSNNFVFVISRNSIKSDNCRKELAYANDDNIKKRLIPIVIEDVDFNLVDERLAKINCIKFHEGNFDENIEKLKTALRTDADWVDCHTNLLTHALEWERDGKKRDPSFLIRGKELQDAEDKLAKVSADARPQPTDTQKQFVNASRQDTSRRQRRSFIALSIALVLVIGLAIVAFILRGVAAEAQVNAENAEATAVVERDMKATAQVNAQNAEATAVVERDMKATAEVVAVTQRDLAFSRQLAAQARLMMTQHQFDLGLLLAIEASGRSASSGSSDGLWILSDLLQAEPMLVRIVSSEKGYISNGLGAGFIAKLALSPDGNQLVAKSDHDEMFKWDLVTRQSWSLKAEEYQQQYQDLNPAQELASDEIEQLLQEWDPNRVLDPGTFSRGLYTKASNRVAISACRNVPNAGGAPSCDSLIYVFEQESNHLITRLESCSPTAEPSDLSVKYQDGSLHISGGLPPELHSMALANEVTNSDIPFMLPDARYDPQHKWIITATAVGRMQGKLALIVWDRKEEKQVLELFAGNWGSSFVKINPSNANGTVDICSEVGTGIQVDLKPESWQQKACEMAGRNMTDVEWRQFFGEKPKQKTCPQWP